MESIELISFLLLGLAAVVFKAYRRTRLVDILHLLLFTSVGLLIKNDLSSTENGSLENGIFYGLVGVVALNYILSKWKGYRHKYTRIVPPLLTFGAFWIFFGSGELTYLDSTFRLESIGVVILPFLGLLAYEVAVLKSDVIKKLFGTQDNLTGIIIPLILGVAILIGIFNASGFGVLLIAAGYLAASFYRDEGSKHVLHSLLAISLIWLFATLSDSAESDLRIGKTLMGLFIGAFAVGMINFSWTAKKRKGVLVALSYLIAGFLMILALLMQLQHASFGGMEAFIGIVVGIALANALIGKSLEGMSLLTIMIVIGMYFSSFLVNEEQKAIEQELEIFTETQDENGEVVKIDALPLDQIIGKYSLDKNSAIVSFKLGPKGGVTKGAIKGFTGSIEIAEDVLKSSFMIEMPIANLTTFNSMRDDAIMGPEYLNSDEFKKIIFEGKSLRKLAAEDEYEILGQFTLLGITKDLVVRVLCLDEKGDKFLAGQGTIDRTQFGMTPDTRQGNVITFEFKVKLVPQ